MDGAPLRVGAMDLEQEAPEGVAELHDLQVGEVDSFAVDTRSLTDSLISDQPRHDLASLRQPWRDRKSALVFAHACRSRGGSVATLPEAPPLPVPPRLPPLPPRNPAVRE